MIYDHECNGAEVQRNFGDVSLSCQMPRRKTAARRGWLYSVGKGAEDNPPRAAVFGHLSTGTELLRLNTPWQLLCCLFCYLCCRLCCLLLWVLRLKIRRVTTQTHDGRLEVSKQHA